MYNSTSVNEITISTVEKKRAGSHLGGVVGGRGSRTVRVCGVVGYTLTHWGRAKRHYQSCMPRHGKLGQFLNASHLSQYICPWMTWI